MNSKDLSEMVTRAEEALKDLAVLLDIAKRGGVFNPPDTIRLALERLQKLEQVNNG